MHRRLTHPLLLLHTVLWSHAITLEVRRHASHRSVHVRPHPLVVDVRASAILRHGVAVVVVLVDRLVAECLVAGSVPVVTVLCALHVVVWTH